MVRLVESKSVAGEDSFMSVIIISSDLNHIEWEIMGIVGYKCPGIPGYLWGIIDRQGSYRFFVVLFLQNS
jgi:hypothetical protein